MSKIDISMLLCLTRQVIDELVRFIDYCDTYAFKRIGRRPDTYTGLIEL